MDWAGMFAEAGLPVATFTAVAPTRVPAVFADAHAVWAGPYPGRPDLPVRIEGAALAGRPVYFEITGPWSRGSAFQQTQQPAAFLISSLVVTAIALILGGVLARRNIRHRRGDTRGALRIATCAFVLLTISTLVGMHHAWSVRAIELAMPARAYLRADFLAAQSCAGGNGWLHLA